MTIDSTVLVLMIESLLSIGLLLFTIKGKMPTSEKPYLNFVIEPELLKRLDDFRFKQRFATRAAAIKWLLDWALKQKPTPDGG